MALAHGRACGGPGIGGSVVVAAIAFTFLVASSGPATASQDDLMGAWVMDAITVISPRGQTSYPDPQPGIFMFADGYYSMVWMLTTEPLPDSAETWKPTDVEKVDSFDSVIVNSGTFTLTDSLLTTHPMVAKTPEFVGGVAVYRYRVEADTLWMESVDIRSRGGVQDPGVGKFQLPLRLVRPWARSHEGR